MWTTHTSCCLITWGSLLGSFCVSSMQSAWGRLTGISRESCHTRTCITHKRLEVTRWHRVCLIPAFCQSSMTTGHLWDTCIRTQRDMSHHAHLQDRVDVQMKSCICIFKAMCRDSYCVNWHIRLTQKMKVTYCKMMSHTVGLCTWRSDDRLHIYLSVLMLIWIRLFFSFVIVYYCSMWVSQHQKKIWSFQFYMLYITLQYPEDVIM